MQSLSSYIAVTFETTLCISCGVHIAMPSALYHQRVEDHKTFYCPNGHPQHFVGETVSQKLKKAQEQIDILNTRIKETTMEMTVLRNKTQGPRHDAVRNCPICGDGVRNLTLHIKRKHPDHVG